jgi:hypothetical protein
VVRWFLRGGAWASSLLVARAAIGSGSSGWTTHSGGMVWLDAVVGGITAANSRPYYVCRANVGGGIHPGLMMAGDDHCLVAYGGGTQSVTPYDLLQPTWVTVGPSGSLPANAVALGTDSPQSGSATLYVCRAQVANGLLPGKTTATWHPCNVGTAGAEATPSTYDVLVGTFPVAAEPPAWPSTWPAPASGGSAPLYRPDVLMASVFPSPAAAWEPG